MHFLPDLMALGPITSAISDVSGDAAGIKASMLVILGVLVTIGIAWAIVRGLNK